MVGRERRDKGEDPFVFLRHLARERVPFVIVGGAALALHGIPRSTLDIDVVIPASASGLPGLFSAATRAGLRSQQSDILRIAEPGAWIEQWVTFQDTRGREWVDVFLEEPKVFDRLMKGSVRRRVGRLRLCIASLGDMERMKRKAGRPIDLADIALIREKRRAAKGGG